MDNLILKELANELFFDYLKNNPKSKKGQYLSKRTNQILAFDEYMSLLSDDELRKKLQKKLKSAEIKQLRKIINSGIEKYLADNIKTLALG